MNVQSIAAFLKLHWVTVGAILTAVWSKLSPTVPDAIHNHPWYAMFVGLLGMIVSFYWTSPTQVPPVVQAPVPGAPVV